MRLEIDDRFQRRQLGVFSRAMPLEKQRAMTPERGRTERPLDLRKTETEALPCYDSPAGGDTSGTNHRRGTPAQLEPPPVIEGGIRTVSITWITPSRHSTSLSIILASFTRTLPLANSKATDSP